MNERIRALAQQADPDYTGNASDDMGHALVGDEAIEKFAELIVQECSRVLEDNELGGYRVDHVLREHFAVDKD